MKRAPNFDRLAGVYRFLEAITFGPMLARCRNAYLPELRTARSALVYGDGDGRFTARLLRENPVILLDAADASRSMLKALMLRAGIHAGRIRIHPVDARLWDPPPGPFDLIVTHFFLDCLSTEDVVTLARRLRTRIVSNGRWIISDFATPNNALGWFVGRPLVASLYLAFDLLTGLNRLRLPDYAVALSQAGFVLHQQRKLLFGLLVSEEWIPTPQKTR